jgi:hypothetical protein
MTHSLLNMGRMVRGSLRSVDDLAGNGRRAALP